MQANTIAFVGALVSAAVLVGCQPTRTEMQEKEMRERAMELSLRQMELVAEINKSVIGFGCVSIRPQPGGATLTVDGAEILDDADGLTMPLGVHEFAARWPDGATTSRRVFVPQMNVTYDINYETTMGSSGGHIKHSGKPDVKKTVIVLKKPAK